MNPGKHIHGADAFVAQFEFELDRDMLPIVFVCPQPWCETTLWMEGVRIRRAGFITCMACLKPMVRIDATVH